LVLVFDLLGHRGDGVLKIILHALNLGFGLIKGQQNFFCPTKDLLWQNSKKARKLPWWISTSGPLYSV
jgi:hypothetical protein